MFQPPDDDVDDKIANLIPLPKKVMRSHPEISGNLTPNVHVLIPPNSYPEPLSGSLTQEVPSFEHIPPPTNPPTPFITGMKVGDMDILPTPEDVAREAALRKGGARFDAGKSRVDLIPAEVLLLLGEIYEMGARKYDASNWRKGMKWSKVYGPLFRHLLKYWMGQKLDEESQKLHIMHVVWNAVALALYSIKPEYKQFDDRQDPVNIVDMPEEERQRLYV